MSSKQSHSSSGGSVTAVGGFCTSISVNGTSDSVTLDSRQEGGIRMDESLRKEIEERAAQKKIENAERSEQTHRELQEQFKQFAEKAWMKRFAEETEAMAEQKQIEEAEEIERYERDKTIEKCGLITVKREVSSITINLSRAEAYELMDDIDNAVGLKNFPYTLLEKIGVFLSEELERND